MGPLVDCGASRFESGNFGIDVGNSHFDRNFPAPSHQEVEMEPIDAGLRLRSLHEPHSGTMPIGVHDPVISISEFILGDANLPPVFGPGGRPIRRFLEVVVEGLGPKPGEKIGIGAVHRDLKIGLH
jgi:hypothetical protein